VPLTPAVVRVMRAFADSTFEMHAMSELAATVGVKNPSSDAVLVSFKLPAGNVLALCAADGSGENDFDRPRQ
jgi:hypothetical protein